ncbi:hypothetical protein Sjap_020030 [Stephania japonica]|uniref:Uncharacterized protein n=1 Tax=Stephania japonica TaxID=461633 RepID=A0AAP0F1C0_9MAGN
MSHATCTQEARLPHAICMGVWIEISVPIPAGHRMNLKMTQACPQLAIKGPESQFQRYWNTPSHAHFSIHVFAVFLDLVRNMTRTVVHAACTIRDKMRALERTSREARGYELGAAGALYAGYDSSETFASNTMVEVLEDLHHHYKSSAMWFRPRQRHLKHEFLRLSASDAVSSAVGLSPPRCNLKRDTPRAFALDAVIDAVGRLATRRPSAVLTHSPFSARPTQMLRCKWRRRGQTPVTPLKE